MKPGKTFNLSKTAKRMLAQFSNGTERSQWKKMMIEAELAAAAVPKTLRDRGEARPTPEPTAE
jgi:hypothetical protein